MGELDGAADQHRLFRLQQHSADMSRTKSDTHEQDIELVQKLDREHGRSDLVQEDNGRSHHMGWATQH